MMENAYKALKEHLGLDECGYDTVNQDWYTVEEFDERVMEQFDIDFRRVFLKGSSEYERIESEDGTWIDELGFTRRYSGGYGEMTDHPLRHAETITDIENFNFFDPGDPVRVEGLRERAEYLFNETDYALVAAGAVGGILEACCWFRGFDQFPVDLMVDKELAHCLLEKYTSYCESLMEEFLDVAGPYLQVVEMADDLGSQSNLLISPEFYRETCIPRLRKVADACTKPWVYHTDGNFLAVIDDLLDLGTKGLQPIEPQAIDIFDFKKTYGLRVCTMGNIDLDQLTLGTTTEVAAEVETKLKALSVTPGYIMSSSNSLTVYCKDENVMAMVDAFCRFR